MTFFAIAIPALMGLLGLVLATVELTDSCFGHETNKFRQIASALLISSACAIALLLNR